MMIDSFHGWTCLHKPHSTQLIGMYFKPWLVQWRSWVCVQHRQSTNMHACHSPSLFVSRTPFPFPPHCFYAHIHTHTQGDTRGRVDAALSALRWGVLLLTTVWIEAAVHPLLSGCCRAAGLTFVLRSIMARHNYSLSREGTQAVSTLPLASPQLAGQQRHTQANISFKCVLKLNYVSPWCVTVTGTGSHALVNLAYSKPYSLASLPPGSSSGLIVIDKVNKQTKITYICRQASVFPTHIATWLAIDDDIRCVTQIIGKNIKFCRLARLCLTPIFHRAGVSNSN